MLDIAAQKLASRIETRPLGAVARRNDIYPAQHFIAPLRAIRAITSRPRTAVPRAIRGRATGDARLITAREILPTCIASLRSGGRLRCLVRRSFDLRAALRDGATRRGD